MANHTAFIHRLFNAEGKMIAQITEATPEKAIERYYDDNTSAQKVAGVETSAWGYDDMYSTWN